MAKQVINVGTLLNDGKGDTLRNGAQKINDNFSEIYDTLGGIDGNPLSIVSSLSAGDGGAIFSSPSGTVRLTIQPASEDSFGTVKVGHGIIVNNGVISVAEYVLPKAASNILGGIKVGDRLSISNEGVLSADVQTPSIPVANQTTSGTVKIDGVSIGVNNGIISVTGEMPLPVIFPSLTTLERTALGTVAAGTVIFNSSAEKLQVYAGGIWVNLH